MTGLGKTVSQLSRFLRQRATPSPGSLPPIAAQEDGRVRIESGRAGDAFATCPRGLDGSLPLVVVLHGCTQTAAAYDHGSGWSALAERCGFAVLYPEQAPANNPKRCFNWFQPADTARNSGEVLSILQMIERLALDHGIDRRRIFVTGLSAGGAMAAVMLATYPEIFAGGADDLGPALSYRRHGQGSVRSNVQGPASAPRSNGAISSDRPRPIAVRGRQSPSGTAWPTRP